MSRAGEDAIRHPLRCRCGTLRGHVVPARSAKRAICYCRDCQAYARFLGTGDVADASGGTEVVATLPRQVHLTDGLDALACLSLSPRGLLRWYAQCCDTPIGNTPRNPALAYVGLVHSCLGDDASRAASFGRIRLLANTRSARGPVRERPPLAPLALLGVMRTLLVARITGAHEHNPFFLRGTRTPVRPVRVLDEEERRAAYGR